MQKRHFESLGPNVRFVTVFFKAPSAYYFLLAPHSNVEAVRVGGLHVTEEARKINSCA